MRLQGEAAMNRVFFAAAMLVLMADNECRAQTTEPGPGDGGSVLKDPYAPAAPPKPAASGGTYVESLINQTPMGTPNPADRYLRPFEQKADINQDIQVVKEIGPWLIMVHAYSGPEAAIMARQMVIELRGNY